MKQKSHWLSEALISFFFLGSFALLRFTLISEKKNMSFGDEVIAITLIAIAVTVAALLYVRGNRRGVFSFSHDALVLSIVGYFLWNLHGPAGYLVIFSLAIFALLTISSAVSTIQLFRVNNPSSEQRAEMFSLHDFINRCLVPKFVIVALGAILIEKLLVPIMAG